VYTIRVILNCVSMKALQVENPNWNSQATESEGSREIDVTAEGISFYEKHIRMKIISASLILAYVMPIYLAVDYFVSFRNVSDQLAFMDTRAPLLTAFVSISSSIILAATQQKLENKFFITDN